MKNLYKSNSDFKLKRSFIQKVLNFMELCDFEYFNIYSDELEFYDKDGNSNCHSEFIHSSDIYKCWKALNKELEELTDEWQKAIEDNKHEITLFEVSGPVETIEDAEGKVETLNNTAWAWKITEEYDPSCGVWACRLFSHMGTKYIGFGDSKILSFEDAKKWAETLGGLQFKEG